MEIEATMQAKIEAFVAMEVAQEKLVDELETRIDNLKAELTFVRLANREMLSLVDGTNAKFAKALARIAELEAQLAAVPQWNLLTATNRPDDGVYAIWIRRPISGDVLVHYLDMGFQWAPYDTPLQVES